MRKGLGPSPQSGRLSGTSSGGQGPDETISVIICAYTEDRLAIMGEAIASVRNQTRPADEIVLVIDHNEALAERLRQSEYGITVVESQEQPGLSGARNHGVAVTTGSIIAFLDDDAVADPDWLDQLVDAYEHPDVAGVGGFISPRWMGTRPRYFPQEFDWVVGCSYRGMPEQRQAVRNLIGANMSFRRRVFDTSGLFRCDLGRVGSLPLGCEETELCIRHSSNDPQSRFVYEPRARVEHLVPPTRQAPRYFFRRCYGEGLSKAAVVAQAGTQDGLSSEASHVMRALPRGVVAGVRTTITDREIDGVARAGTIVMGLAATTAGYCVGTARRLWHQPVTSEPAPEPPTRSTTRPQRKATVRLKPKASHVHQN